VPLKVSIKLSILGNRSLYLIVILFNTLDFVHFLHCPSSFGIINIGTKHKLMLSLISPFDSNSTTYQFNIMLPSNSFYAQLESNVQSCSLVAIHLPCYSELCCSTHPTYSSPLLGSSPPWHALLFHHMLQLSLAQLHNTTFLSPQLSISPLTTLSPLWLLLPLSTRTKISCHPWYRFYSSHHAIMVFPTTCGKHLRE
jgi:hypothetical protein